MEVVDNRTPKSVTFSEIGPNDGHEPINGIGYVMCKQLNEFQKDTLRQYPNVVLTIVNHRYAREIIHDMVFIGDSNRPDGR